MDDRILLPPPPVEVRGDTVAYVGLGIGALGLVLTVVGLGEKVTRLPWRMDWTAVRVSESIVYFYLQGFQTMELQLVGPSIILCGVLVNIIL